MKQGFLSLPQVMQAKLRPTADASDNGQSLIGRLGKWFYAFQGDERLNLADNSTMSITVLATVPTVRIELGAHTPLATVKKKAVLATGDLIATHASPEIGDLHAPFNATVSDVTTRYIELTYQKPVDGEATEEVNSQAAVSFDGLDKNALLTTLKSLGISTGKYTQLATTVVINGINPEPGMFYSKALLTEYKDTLNTGLALIRRLSEAKEYLFALPEGQDPCNFEGVQTRTVKAVYPVSLDKPLIYALTKSEDTANYNVIGLHALFQLGLVANSGLPLTQVLLTAFGHNYLVPLGTPISTLAKQQNISITAGDAIIVGGAMRGMAVKSMDRGLGKDNDALILACNGTTIEREETPCINCSACVSACPMRLSPNMLSRYAEVEQYEECRKEHLEACIECGMCGYSCPMQRPMQQLFSVAKSQLGLKA